MIVIDPGHGGTDYGGGSNEYWLEKDLTLKISNYQYNRFKELGIPVKMTRYTDTTISPNERVEAAKGAFGASDNVILLSNHINIDFGNFDGAEVIYSVNRSPDFANKIAEDLQNAGQNINRIFNRKNSVGKDFYYIIRNTQPMNSVIVEYGFADSKGDDINQLRNNWESLAEAVVKGVTEYLGYPYTAPKNNYYLYTVKDGDSLYKIANKTGTSINDIKTLNNLVNDDLAIGQVLKIPNMRHIDTKTLYEYSRKLNIKPFELLSYLNPFNLILKAGQKIKVYKKK